MKLAPSILASNFADMPQVVKLIESSKCEYIHFDVMDGHFVPNLTFGPHFIQLVRRMTEIPFDVHLMVERPQDYVAELIDIGVQMLTFHIEVCPFGPRLVSELQEAGVLASVSLNPATPLTSIEELLPLVDNVLLMTVDPGFYGQELIPTTLHKVEKLRAYREEHDLLFTIQVDGGINESNIMTMESLGVDIVVVGKSFFQAGDPIQFAARVHGSRRRFHA